MRPIMTRIFNNVCSPVRLASWVYYQKSRPGHRDYFLATMPASGTHWVRLMLAKGVIEKYSLPESVEAITTEDLLPTYRNKLHRFKYNSMHEVPRIQHSHAFYSSLFFRNTRVIYLVRDLRDTLVSHFRTYRDTKDPEVKFSAFLRGVGIDRPGQKKGHTLNTLIDYLNSWDAGSESLDSVLLIKYEDLKQNTLPLLQLMYEFCGLGSISEKRVGEIIDFCSIENMSRIESKNPLPQYGDKVKKVRYGDQSRYSDYFTREDIEYFSSVVSRRLNNHLGYDYTSW